MRNSKLQTVIFLADSVLKFSTEIYIFIKHSKNWDLLHFLVDSQFQYYPEKANLMKNFCSMQGLF